MNSETTIAVLAVAAPLLLALVLYLLKREATRILTAVDRIPSESDARKIMEAVDRIPPVEWFRKVGEAMKQIPTEEFMQRAFGHFKSSHEHAQTLLKHELRLSKVEKKLGIPVGENE